MKYKRLLALSAFCLLALAGTFGFIDAAPALAQVDTGINAVGETIVLEEGDPRVIAARIINIFLGLIGIILVVLILYAGFLWMTSGGDAAKIEQAKLYIRNAIIGLVIVLSSWAIATFVINQLLEATGPGGGGPSGGAGPGGGLGGTGAGSAFQLRSISPSGEIRIRNVTVRFHFSRNVNEATVAGNIEVVRASDGVPVDGTFGVSGSVVTFTPSAACPAPNDDRFCFESDTEFIARADTDVESTTGQSLVCGGFAAACEGRFTTGDLVDTANPEVQVLAPFNGQNVSVNDAITITSRATDDAGVSYIDTAVDGALVDSITSPTTETTLEGDIFWDTTGVALGRHTIQSTAYDIDSNTDLSSTVTVYVRPAYCFNGTLDGDETGLDCGGSCGACTGGSCTTGDECASGVCSAGVCVAQPIITGFSPDDGRPGTLVTVSGANFGTTPGTVTFADGVTASAPAVCTDAGFNTWSNAQVVVELPSAAVTGPISLTNAETALSDTTINDLGPVLDNFEVNDTARPGLCGARPASGLPGELVEFIGAGLGSTSELLTFNDREVRTFRGWSDSTISLQTPVFTPARYGVTAVSGGVESNSVVYRILERGTGAAPVIDNITPDAGPIGEYITLNGRNFGTRVGRVLFTNSAREQGDADIDFPEACSLNFWTDTSIVVKVPPEVGLSSDVTPGGYGVRVIRQDIAESNSVDFTVNTETPRPGICAIRPQAGPVDTEVQIVGERFGSSGTVTFKGPGDARQEARVDARDYTSSLITTNVPSGAETGSVTVEVGASLSNPVEFAVRNCNEDATICSAAGETCCRTGACSVGGACPAVSLNARYAWRTSTGIIPINPMVIEECNDGPLASPSPWDERVGGNRACVNSDVILRFTTELDDSTVVGSGAGATILVNRCTAGGENPCATTELVAPRAGFPTVGPAGDGTDYIVFRPNLPGNEWAPTATYRVTLRTGISSNTGIPMLVRPECGDGNSYCFTFTTRAADDVCRVGSVSIMPDPYTANEIGQTIPYRGFPRAADDICISLDGSSMPWRWDTDGDGRASITNDPAPDPSRQTATALGEAGEIPVPIRGEVLPPDGPAVGIGDLFIRFIPPKVVAYGPNCDEACVNAAIWARFNVAMHPASVTRDNVVIYRCANENCLTFDPLSPLPMDDATVELRRTPESAADSPRNYLFIAPTRPGAGGTPVTMLEPGRFYKVILRGGATGFLSSTRLPLVETNDPFGFSWVFRVKGGDNPRCGVDRVDMTPVEKFERNIGDRESFVATPVGAPDSCNRNGQPLITDMSFAWSQSDPLVAKFIRQGGDGLIDTTANLPAGCTTQCLNEGASGIAGRVANCGNGAIETSNGEYCRSAGGGPCAVGEGGCRTIHGASFSCVRLPDGSKGAEECDDAGANGPAGRCSNACLWNPVSGGTCGNGALQPGEQCDVARFCEGGATPGAACTADADCGEGTCAVVRGCSDTCQLMGSRSGGSVCGNGSIGAGEACDDGNTTNGDGCSSICLHEGAEEVISLCGDGAVDDGESCDGGPGCDPVTCLNIGTDACGDPSSDTNCCGNGTTELGEDLDDGNTRSGDGVSSRCLLEGSSAGYSLPSFCGDGIPLGTGEQCEAVAPDGLIDGLQLSEIVGDAVPGADGRMSSTLSADYEDRTGEGAHGLQCGFTEEASCTTPGTGLTNNGCCSARPTLTTVIPSNASREVCRNVMVTGVFNQVMDRASLEQNFIIASEEAGDVCPGETTPLVDELSIRHPIINWFANVWRRIVSFFGFTPADALVWCVGETRGRVITAPEGDGTRVMFELQNALKANTRYKVVFRGDYDLADAEKAGIRSSRGVVVVADPVSVDSGNFTWSFETSAEICSVSTIRIQDTFPENPALFTEANEMHDYVADVITLAPGYSLPISPVAEYAWGWQPWMSSDNDVLAAAAAVETPEESQAEVTSRDINGASYIYAGVAITTDTIGEPSTVGDVIRSSLLSTVMLCEQPWPPREFAPFRDQDGSTSLLEYAPSFAASGQFFNFSMLYCKDAGSADSTADDLPHATLSPIPLLPLDTGLGILRQYLLTFEEPSLAADGIGIRVVQNPLHLSAINWYRSRGFTGSPEATTVDGYEALREGGTVYVSGANTDASTSGDVFSNIYILSHNPDAKPETQNIFNQLVENFTLNVNIENNSMNTCMTLADAPYIEDGNMVSCTADWECLQRDPTTRCASFKSKLQRDITRIAHFQQMTETLEDANERNASYPLLRDGSFVQTLSNSRWPSWQASFAAEAGGNLPTDPVNRFLTCGRCGGDGTVCTDSSECSDGQTCDPFIGGGADATGLDPATCWNTNTQLFHCPVLDPANPDSVSRIYQYRAVDGGNRYELATELEGPSPNRWAPPLREEIFTCSNLESICLEDSDCTVRNTAGVITSEGTCNPTGGRWLYEGICRGRSYGIDDVCGNGVIGPGEVCELGDTRAVACTATGGVPGTEVRVCSDCRAFVDSSTTSCVPNLLCGNGRVDRARCSTVAGGPGVREGTSCFSIGSTTECADPGDPAGTSMVCAALPASERETCDDGALNGTYGHCGIDCRGFDAFCGDGELSPGESCDNGSRNGQYWTPADPFPIEASCSFDCRGRAPYCGDRRVDGGSEQCDGNVETTTLALCRGGANAEEPCGSHDDCPGILNGCGGSIDFYNFDTCVGDTVNRCTNIRTCAVDADCTSPERGAGNCVEGLCRNDTEFACTNDDSCDITSLGIVVSEGQCVTRDTQRIRNCVATIGEPRINPFSGSISGTYGASDLCRYKPWSDCQPVGICGDGTVDTGEACDDGNRNNNDACTNNCTVNVCGDGAQYTGVEQCDYGTRNGLNVCRADYGSTCINCSTTCRQVASSGGFCGDNIRNGGEQCDGEDGLAGVTCSALGFDFAENVQCRSRGYVTFNGEYEGIWHSPVCCAGNVLGNWSSPRPDTAPSCFPRGGVFAEEGNCREFPSSGTGLGIVPQELADRVCATGTPIQDAISCSSACGYNGCLRCSETTGTETISGQVFDALYFQQPVPNARVTLFQRGVRVDEAFTANDGTFELTGLVGLNQCANYRIIIDSFNDNPCTGPRSGTEPPDYCNSADWPSFYPRAVNEAEFGGYWPYESRIFGPSNFRSHGIQSTDGKIFLAPRVGPGETLVVHTWNGSLNNDYIDAHLVLPRSQKFEWQSTGTNAGIKSDDVYRICLASESGCIRDVHWGGDDADTLAVEAAQGNANMDLAPHANLYCISTGGTSDSCNSFNFAPQTIKFKRGPWSVTGKYSYYLVDFSEDNLPSYEYFYQTSSTVRVITESRIFTVDAPQFSSDPCSGGDAIGKFWLIFQQDAASGAITIPSRIESSRCAGDDALTERPGDPAMPLPNPMLGT